MQVTKLLIARHGNTFGPNDTVRRVGITDLPLVQSGLIQGEKLGHYLKAQQLIPDLIFTSELKRAQQTAEEVVKVLSKKISIQTASIFNEIDYGPDENISETEVAARLGQEALKNWELNAEVPQGWKVDPIQIIQNWFDFSQMVEKNYLAKTIMVVTSNGIARFSPHLTGDFTSFANEYGIKMATGALSIFEKKNIEKKWNCIRWNLKPAVELDK